MEEHKLRKLKISRSRFWPTTFTRGKTEKVAFPYLRAIRYKYNSAPYANEQPRLGITNILRPNIKVKCSPLVA